MEYTASRFFRLGRSLVGRYFVYFSLQSRRIQFPKRIQLNQIKKYNVGLLLTIPVSLVPSVMAASEDNKALIDESEALYDKKEFLAMYDLLSPHKESSDANVLWRLARAATEKGKIVGGEDRKTLIFEAFEYSKKALELDDNNFACHKWYGILLDYTAEYEGNKKRLSNAFHVKEHFLKAIELNPKDATTMYCLGLWCFLFADMAWYERKIAAVIFTSPPTSSYGEALEHFKKAEEAEPDFYNQNKVMIGKTLMRMKEWDEAKKVLLKAWDHDDKTADDAKAREEAQKLLKELRVDVASLPKK